MHLSAEWAGESIGWLKSRKIKTRPLLAELKLDESHLTFGQQIPAKHFAAILDYGAMTTSDAFFGLHRGSEFRIKNGGVLAYLAASAVTVSDAISQYQRYASIVCNGFTVEVKHERDGVRLVLRVSDPVWRTCRHLGEFAAARTIAALREFTGINIRPLRVAFMHPQAGDAPECRRFFRCNIGHDHGGDMIKFSGETVAIPIPAADSHLGIMVRSYADGLLDRAHESKGKPLEGRVKSVITQNLTSGAVSLRAVASQLNLSDRTLRRHLRASNVTFGEILDEVRRDLANQWLSGTDFDLKHISFLLGYSEPAAFSRAYRRWTGQSPAHARGG